MIKPLSPAAQAVLDTALDVEFRIEFTDLEATIKASVRRANAAALRAAVAATQARQSHDCWICDAAELLAIAAELEALPND